ncbi:MAG: replicative DNA helicase [Actinobacteria bacterium RBG_19FT_COMBO_54_7]|uniref:Replicative DNA helicase n=1 Tax=Candidatus Solincola sediminis TaxID=1797199 RepID=A0A1F2WR30_9ACTN|nr:MAG: replicative DNA helicase [Candidatus Solincola sediminis]OFW61116.1 MAG: replicative DNA helicase [Candidatus Solincola sediminis]OFW67199.1 MAG: replicative DNA helicase [Actinobacteria bacterium RBG_19FT_COMBO_54_7]
MSKVVQAFDRQDHLPPHSMEAEESVLGSMLLSSEALVDVSEILTSHDFYRESHALIFDTALSLFASGEPVDPLTVAELLRSQGKLEKVGDRSYILNLMSSVPTPANAKYYAEVVMRLATYRRLIEAAGKVAAVGYRAPEGLAEALDQAEGAIFAVAQRERRESIRAIKDLMETTFEDLEKISQGEIESGIKTGFVDLDELTSGLQPSDLIVVAARPSMGKTSLALNIADHVAVEERVPVAIFSLEMSAQELTRRMLCSRARVNSQKLKSSFLDDDVWQRLSDAAGELTSASIFIDDNASIGIMEMRSKLRRLKTQHDIGLVIVDYIQLMNSERMHENRVQEIASISRGLKVLGRDFNIPVIAVSQLSREPEKHNRKPILSDLRESGAIEQDADLIVFIHREEIYDRENEEVKGRADVNVAKHRNGPTGPVKLTFQAQFARFLNYARREADRS